MHTDESINAYIIGQLLAGDSFHYDPQDRHGPALAAETLPLVKLFGAKNFTSLTESELRLAPVLAGSMTVLLFGAGVEIFGFAACFIAACCLPLARCRFITAAISSMKPCLSPHAGLDVVGWRALQTKQLWSAALTGFCAALMVACKETAVIHFFALACAGGACWLWNKRTHPRAFSLRMAAMALAAFLFTGILLFTWFGRNWAVFLDC